MSATANVSSWPSLTLGKAKQNLLDTGKSRLETVEFIRRLWENPLCHTDMKVLLIYWVGAAFSLIYYSIDIPDIRNTAGG
jgi:hypothetical protein